MKNTKTTSPTGYIAMVMAILMSGCVTAFGQLDEANRKTESSSPRLKFISEYVIPYDLKLDSTTIGGLSGIEYDSLKKQYYFISDDRGMHGNLRVYQAEIQLDSTAINDVTFTNVIFLKDKSGKIYDRANASGNPDPEGLRIDASKKLLYWTSEGERALKKNIIIDPAVNVSDSTGKVVFSFPVPRNVKMSADEKGPRQNSTFEGISLDDAGKSLYVSIEEPLYGDGPVSDFNITSATSRILKYDIASGKNVAQYGYTLEPVAYPVRAEIDFRINGITEILCYSKDKLIVVERSFSTGRLTCTIRVFLADLSGASDISDLHLSSKQNVRKVTKTLLLNMDSLKIPIDNIEGVTFGPVLPNGNRTLLFVSDNNFNWFQTTQLLLFEIKE